MIWLKVMSLSIPKNFKIPDILRIKNNLFLVNLFEIFFFL